LLQRASIKEKKMQNMFRISLILLLIITCFVFTASCAKKKVEPDLSFDEAAKQAEEARLEELERQLSLEEERLAAAAEEAEREMIAAREMLMDEDIYFKKGISSLSPEAKEILMKKARWLQDNPDISVIIQGHSDEPGSAEFNLALGEKRAGKVKTFLIKLGISSSRLIPVSYGKERPVASGENKEDRSKNRRVHFVIE
jgi:peptidoglycan-associated lipoprotein